MKAFRASGHLYEVRTHLSLANMEIGKMTYHDPIYAGRVKEFNQVMVELVRGKWLAACAMEQACNLLTMLDKHDPAYIPLQQIFVRAEEELSTGTSAESSDHMGLSQ